MRKDNRHHAPSMIQLGRRVLLTLGWVSLTLIALWLWLSWYNTKQVATQRMTAAAGLIAGHATNFFDLIGSHMGWLADDLRRIDAANHPEQALELLRRFVAKHPQLASAALIRPDGQILTGTAQTQGMTPNVLSQPEWREDFYANLKGEGLSINRPRIGDVPRRWIIPLRYTVRDEQGKMVFLIQASIPLENQQALWRDLPLPRGSGIGLLREDGYLISRWPDENLKQIYLIRDPKKPLSRAIKSNPNAGLYQGVTWNEQYRVGAYRHLEHYPLYAFISLPRSALLGLWWQGVQIPLYLALGGVVAAIFFYRRTTRRFAANMAVIGQRLEETDPASRQPLPSSGVSEIDALCDALSEARQRLHEASKNRERSLLAAADAGTYTVRLSDGIVLNADQEFLRMLGKSAQEVIDRPWTDLLCHPTAEDYTLHEGTMSHVVECTHKSGGSVWLSVAEYLDRSDGEAVRQGLAIDVSQREALLRQVQTDSKRLQALWRLATRRDMPDDEKVRLTLHFGLETLGMDMAMVGEFKEGQYIIRHAVDPGGTFSPGQIISSGSPCSLAIESRQSIVVPDLTLDETYGELADLGIRVYISIPIWMGEQIYGTLVFSRREPQPGGFSDDDKAFVELLASWFGQTFLQQEQRHALEELAMTDSLTGLPNRRAADSRLAGEIARARRTSEYFAIALCDLDRFKLINDHYGHDIGDEVLQQIAGIMKDALREGDWVARWGGEEFFVFLHQSDGTEAFVAMDRLRQALRAKPVQTRLGPLEITASIGIGLLRGPEEDIAQLLAEADGCLYEAKKRGRDSVVVSEAARRGTLWKAGMLQRALKENRIVPAYQTIVDLNSRAIVAEEILARLVESDGNVVPAGDFIEAAEGINLVHLVDKTIIQSAMKHCAASLSKDPSRPVIAHFINLSPQFLARKDLVKELLDEAKRLCTVNNIRADMTKPLVFEITERQLLKDFDDLATDLKPLLDLGFRLALDDFGSGYSSFLYLAELPISFLKIEGWMVRNMRHNPRVEAMVQMIVHLAQKQGITTIAEYVEDSETAELLREMGVDWGQGYYFSYPEQETALEPKG
ncbi:MAG: EAL domain-containing protein [Gammaproteobacteria bacterium]|nr:EAL domain-containing protein [Gammaproteobacteria bacterium]